MTISVSTVLRVVAVLSWLDGDIAQNVFNAVVTGAGAPWDEEDIVADALEWVEDMYATFVNSMSDEIDGSEIRVYEYDPIDDDWDEVGSDAWVFNPVGALDQLPRGVAGLVNAKTIDPDVSGKKYWPGTTESAVDDGLWNAGELSRFVTAGGLWVTPFVGGTSAADWAPVIWSPTYTTPYLMTGTIIVPTIPAYQRRRKQGVGI